MHSTRLVSLVPCQAFTNIHMDVETMSHSPVARRTAGQRDGDWDLEDVQGERELGAAKRLVCLSHFLVRKHTHTTHNGTHVEREPRLVLSRVGQSWVSCLSGQLKTFHTLLHILSGAASSSKKAESQCHLLPGL